MRSIVIAALSPLVLLACGERAGPRSTLGAGGSASADALAIPAEPCNPLGSNDCLLPYPSMTFVRADAASPTGYRLALTAAQLPTSSEGAGFDPARWNRADGFSPAGFAAVVFPTRVDVRQLPPHSSIERSIDPQSPTAIVEVPSGRRVPHFAEVDANAAGPARQALLLRPLVRLEGGKRYAVVLRRSLVDIHGEPLPMPDGFRAIVEGRTTDSAALERLRPSYDAIFAAAAAAGIPRDEVLLAWDYVTASDAWIQRPVGSMLETAAGFSAKAPYTITSVVRGGPGDDWKLVARGTFRAPRFLTEGAKATGGLDLDDDGRPRLQGAHDVKFVVVVPKRADTDGPLPLMVYGHGIFGAADSDGELAYMRRMSAEGGFVMLATDWIGLSAADLGPLTSGLPRFSDMVVVTDRLQQALVNAVVLTALGKRALVDEPMLQGGGHSAIDPTRVVYHGNSLGGVMGTALVGWSNDLTRGVMGVPGANWSLLMERSLKWYLLEIVLGGYYPDHVDQQKLILLLQQQFDHSDPINTVPRYAAAPDKRILLQEAIADTAVSNLGCEMMARSLGAELLGPSVKVPYGLPPSAAPGASALTIWELGATPAPPETNAIHEEDNIAHLALRERPAARRQLYAFLATGKVIDVCDGQPCDCAIAGRCD